MAYGNVISLHAIQNSTSYKQNVNNSYLERQLETLVETILLNPKIVTVPFPKTKEEQRKGQFS